MSRGLPRRPVLIGLSILLVITLVSTCVTVQLRRGPRPDSVEKAARTWATERGSAPAYVAVHQRWHSCASATVLTRTGATRNLVVLRRHGRWRAHRASQPLDQITTEQTCQGAGHH
ncbi:hypothetical protein KEM60_03314 [Austwickia sp. TVS 96-490-7B]|nr:hypothetical protein [Austwickia sp. TVS 96-490-7B]